MKNFSGLTITGATPDGYSVKANGYVKGSWLQSSVMQNYGSNTGKVCVFDNSGWIYYRTPSEVLAEAGGAKAIDIPDVSGKANLNGTNNFTGSNTFTDNNVAFIGQNGQTSINGSNVSIQAVGAMGSAEFSVKTDNNNKVFEVISDADNGAIHLNRVINIDNEQQGNVPLCIGGTNAGASGQVLTSQGTGETPRWTTLPIISATLDVANKTLYLTLPSGS